MDIMDNSNLELPQLYVVDEIMEAVNFTFNCEDISSDLEQARDPFLKSPQLRITIILFYILVISCGALGNLLVVAAVIWNPQMRTPRNYFIINLALSDLSLCLLTVPFTMKFLLDNFWTLGRVMCKVVSSAQAVNVFVSTMSITAVGLDRYLVILFPSRTGSQRFALIAFLGIIWSVSIALALPLYFSTDIVPTEPLSQFNISIKSLCNLEINTCAESPDGSFGLNFKRFYAISCFVFQYSVPLITLTFVYGRIIYRLRERASKRANATACLERFQETVDRQNRLNRLLVCIVIIFALSWLPLNIYMTVVAFWPDTYRIETFAVCNMIGMASACANPILYGVFNENFRTEFARIFRRLRLNQAVLMALGYKEQLQDCCQPPQKNHMSVENSHDGSPTTARTELDTRAANGSNGFRLDLASAEMTTLLPPVVPDSPNTATFSNHNNNINNNDNNNNNNANNIVNNNNDNTS